VIATPSKQPAAIRIPHARHEQLRSLAQFHGLTIVGLIERFIETEIAAGNLPPELPGVSIQMNSFNGQPMTSLVIGAHDPIVMTPASMLALAEQIERIATDSGAHLDMDTPATVKVHRVGSAVAIDHGSQRVFTDAPGVARSLAAQIKTAAKGAKAATRPKVTNPKRTASK